MNWYHVIKCILTLVLKLHDLFWIIYMILLRVRNQKTTINPLRANPTKWSNTLKQFVGFCRRIF